MARSKSERRSGRDLVGAVPWAALLQAGLVVSRRVNDLSRKDRERLTRLLRESRGRPGALSEKERTELRKLIGKLDLKKMGRDMLPLVTGKGRKRR
ncbi:MAG TPA: hypothetical protein VFW29_03610 [Solirubrobacteraceae bacterium]|nr:hypothetical protein [Solirubrobacteraceae bacterium]